MEFAAAQNSQMAARMMESRSAIQNARNMDVTAQGLLSVAIRAASHVRIPAQTAA